MNQQENHQQFDRKNEQRSLKRQATEKEIQMVFQQREEAQSHLKLTVD